MKTQAATQVDNQPAAISNSHSFNISFFNNKTDNLAKQETHSWDSLLEIFKTPVIRNDKDGRLISGTIFKENKRRKEQAIESSLLILDFDHVDKIDLSVWRNMGISFAAYTTFSHATNKKPCAYRVVIPLKNPIPADKYALLYQWAFELTNSLIDPACKDISRMQYLPACPSERKKSFEFFSNTGAFLNWQSVIKPLESLDKPTVATSNVIPISTQQAKPKNATKQKERDFSAFVNAAIEDEVNNVRCAVEDNRNNTLNKAAFALGQLVSAEWANANQSSIESLLLDAALSIGLDSNEARATITSGLEKGKIKPRGIPENTIKKQPIKLQSVAKQNSKFSPLDKPINLNEFPHVQNGKPQCTLENLKIILRCYGFNVRYNEITKREETTLNNKSFNGGDSDNIAISKITSVCIINQMSVTHLQTYLLDIAYENTYNPIIEWVESIKWDGESRLKDLEETIETLTSFNQELKSLLLRKWLISAIASAYNRTGEFRSKGVLIFQGKQSVGKTSWFKKLIPFSANCNTAVKDGVSLDVANKDSILKVISHWIVELGELDATFKKSEIAQLKQFIGEQIDIVRRPYAKKESYYPRQTVFCGSVNDEEFLKDPTGNVRFWTIPVTWLDYDHGVDMQQVWAEIAHYYHVGEQWWLTQEQEKILECSNASFVEENLFTSRLTAKLDFNSHKDHRLTSHKALEAIGIKIPTKQDIRDMGALLKNLGFEQKRTNERYFLAHHFLPDF